MPRLEKVQQRQAIFADQTSAHLAAVIWAIGYHDNSEWVSIPQIKDEHGNFIHDKGISPIAGLFFIGRPWQRSGGSAFIGGVGGDAEFITKHVIQYLQKF